MISVVSPTYNGSATLPLLLESLCRVKHPDCGFECIFIDNASTDDSSAVIRQYQDRLPIVLLREGRQGKNFAVSTGVAAAKGDLILFTDDDVIPDSDWLLQYEHVARIMPEVSVFAGQIRHHWLKKPPDWLNQLAADGMAFGGTPVSMQEGETKAVAVKGANFLMRKSLVDQFEFNTNIGPSGSGSYVAGSETEFLLRVEQAGNSIYYVPQACVQHIVRPEQVSLKVVLKRYFRIGRGIALTGVKPYPADSKPLFGYPRFLYKRVAKDGFVALVYVVSGRSYQAVRKLMDIAVAWGRADAWRRASKL